MTDKEGIEAADAITTIVEGCMANAKTSIDNLFGVGYAHQHPELVGAFITAAAINVSAAIVSRSIEHAVDGFTKVLDGVTDDRR